METKELQKQLIAMGRQFNACEEGINELSKAFTKEEIAQCFVEYIDFCLAKNYPNNAFLKRNFEKELEDIGIYIDRSISLKNGRRIVFLGECFGNVDLDDYAVSMIRVKHVSKINIKARGHARIMVDALDHADVIIDASECASVIVNLYGNATCQGATKVIQKGVTYEL